MIDYIALGLGHGLIAIALVHLFMRRDVDFDPLLESFKDSRRQNRMNASSSGRAAQRREQARGERAKNGRKPRR